MYISDYMRFHDIILKTCKYTFKTIFFAFSSNINFLSSADSGVTKQNEHNNAHIIYQYREYFKTNVLSSCRRI